MPKNIQFIPKSQVISDAIPHPKPAKNYIPNWYRDADTFGGKQIARSIATNATFKRCVPVLDAFTAGYIQETWCDIYVEQIEGQALVTWSSPEQPLSLRNQEQSKDWANPVGFGKEQFTWHGPWGVKVPKGYSVLYTHPLNQDDLPFKTLDAIVDADKFNISGLVPFYIKENFEGLIPAGTPMYQMIPIKRDAWISKANKFDERLMNKTSLLVKTKFTGSYRNLYWSKKDYK